MNSHRRSSTLLAAPGARSLLISSLIARLPLAMFSLAILVHARQLTGSFAIAGLASSAYAVFGAVAAPVLGRVIDRTGQTRVLLVGSTACAGILIGLGMLGRGASPVLIIGLAAAAGLTTPPLPACVRTLLPAIVSDPSQLPRLFALESTALELTFVIGPALVLSLGAIWSPGAALVVSGLVLLAGTIAFALQPTSRRWRPAHLPDQPRRRPSSLSSPAIGALVLISFGMDVVFGATEVGVTATAQHLADAAAAAPVLALWGLGSLIGGVVATRLPGGARNARRLLVLLTALAITHGALMFCTGSLMAAGAVILLAGATIAPTAAIVYAMVDSTAPAGTGTEAFSWVAAAGATGAALGAAVAGILVQDIGPAAAFALVGAAGAVTATVALCRAHTLGASGATGLIAAAHARTSAAGAAQRRDGAGEPSHAVRNRTLGEVGVAEDQPATAARHQPVGRDAGEFDPFAPRRADDGGLVEVLGKPRHQVQAGGDAGRLQLGQSARELGQERIPQRSIDRAHAPQMAIELAAGEEVGERQLVQDRRSAVGQQLGRAQRLDEVPRHDDPAEPKAGSERLAGGSRVGDAVGVEALHRTDRCAVIAVLGVVVVLDDQRGGLLRPGQDGGTRLRREHTAGGPLMRGGEDEHIGAQPRQGVDAHAVLSDGHADERQTERRGERAGVVAG